MPRQTALRHRIGNGEAGDRGAEIVEEAAGHFLGIEPERLADLEEEHAERDDEIERQRRLRSSCGARIMPAVQTRASRMKRELQPVGNPGQPAGEELIALRRVQLRAAEGQDSRPWRFRICMAP